MGAAERVDVMCGWGWLNLSQEARVQGVSLSLEVTLGLIGAPSKLCGGLQPHSLELGLTGSRTGGQGVIRAGGRARRQHRAPQPGFFRSDPRPARL